MTVYVVAFWVKQLSYGSFAWLEEKIKNLSFKFSVVANSHTHAQWQCVCLVSSCAVRRKHSFIMDKALPLDNQRASGSVQDLENFSSLLQGPDDAIQ